MAGFCNSAGRCSPDGSPRRIARGIHHLAFKVRESARMAQKPLDPKGGASPLVSGRLHTDQAAWLNELWPHLSGSRSELLRRVVAVAQKHEEELLEVS
jgi:hypothetical protein